MPSTMEILIIGTKNVSKNQLKSLDYHGDIKNFTLGSPDAPRGIYTDILNELDRMYTIISGKSDQEDDISEDEDYLSLLLVDHVAAPVVVVAPVVASVVVVAPVVALSDV